jgi:hypothetical protein
MANFMAKPLKLLPCVFGIGIMYTAMFLFGPAHEMIHAACLPQVTPKSRRPQQTPTPAATPRLITPQGHLTLTIGDAPTSLQIFLSDGTPAAEVTCSIENEKLEYIGFSKGAEFALSGLKETTVPISVFCQNSNGRVEIRVDRVEPEFSAVSASPTPPTLKIDENKIRFIRPDGSGDYLRSLLTDEEESGATRQSFVLPLAKDELIRLKLPDCEPSEYKENKSKTVLQITKKCFQLESSDPEIVSVVGRDSLLGTGKRGQAKISVRMVVLTEIVDRVSNVSRTLEPVVIPGTPFAIPIGTGLTPLSSLLIRIKDKIDRNIIAEPRLKTYQTVRDQYGKAIAKQFLVVAVDIHNRNAAKRFLVQDVSISFDPNQCRKIGELWAMNTSEAFSDRLREIKRQECTLSYQTYFGLPVTIRPSDGNTILAVSEANKYKSGRYILFNAIRFAADIGTGGLSSFKIGGPDAKTAFNFLGSTLFNAADTALPRVSDEKRKNIEKDAPKANVIVNANDSETINIFVPINHVFTKEAWNRYHRSIRDGSFADEFNQYMLLFLIANSDGVLIDPNSTPVKSLTGGGVKTP